MLGYDLTEQSVYFTGHVGRVTAHVEASLLLKEFVHLSGVLLELVLHVDLVRAFTGESSVNLEVVPEDLLVLLIFD